MQVDASYRLPAMSPSSAPPFRALHPYQYAPAEYNPLMPSPDHPPNAPHTSQLRSDHSAGPSEPLDRSHSPHTHSYYSLPPPNPGQPSSSRGNYQSPPSPQFRTHAVNWGLPPISGNPQALPPPSSLAGSPMQSAQFSSSPSGRRSSDDAQRAPQAALLYAQSQQLPPVQPSGAAPSTTRGRSSSVISNSFPRLPPIMQVEKQQVTTSATQAASASRRRNEANFVCPVPGCGSTFTRRFNLRGASARSVCPRARLVSFSPSLSLPSIFPPVPRITAPTRAPSLFVSDHAGHLRSHTAERPFQCEWPGCNKGFARQHDCK